MTTLIPTSCLHDLLKAEKDAGYVSRNLALILWDIEDHNVDACPPAFREKYDQLRAEAEEAREALCNAVLAVGKAHYHAFQLADQG